MSGKYLLDTNIIIALFAEDPSIHEQLFHASEVFIPCIAIGELYFGAYKSLQVKENINKIEKFTLNNTVLACNSETARLYGSIKNHLKEKGQLIPENDIWIAAIALQYELILVTRDSHFNTIKNLKFEAW